MTSIQERLQIKREPLDKWSVREQLCLASAVAKSGDQNWMSVSRALKSCGDPNRPTDWFHQKNCAAQYGALLENVETPKRKKRISGSEIAVETPIEFVLKKLTKDRIGELEKCLTEEKTEYLKLKEDMAVLKSGNVSEELLDKWCKEIEEEEKQREEETHAHAQWLKERELRKQEIERTWRPLGKPSINLPQKRKTPDNHDSFMELEANDENQPVQAQETGKPALSPLLTSLLKSPSQVQNIGNSSILHSAITNQRTIHTSNSTIANLLNSSSGVTNSSNLPQQVHVPVVQEQNPISAVPDCITNDILEGSVDSISNIKDLESTILSSDDPLPEIKNDEVEVIISDLIQNSDIVSDPEQHLHLDDTEDIIANLDNELQELCNEEAAAAAAAAAAVAAAAEAAAAEEVMTNSFPTKSLDKASPIVDPFEFEEDPEISDLAKPANSKYQDKQEHRLEEVTTQQIESKFENTGELKLKEKPGVQPGSVEIVEVVVMEETEIHKQLNKTQIQDIVHSVKPEVNNSAKNSQDINQTNKIQETTEEKNNIEAINNSVFDDLCQPTELEVKSDNFEEKTNVDENATSNAESFTKEYTGSFLDDVNIEVNKLDKSGKAKRDYSRTKKRESEKEFDILLAVEKAVNTPHDSSKSENNLLNDKDSNESDKKSDTINIKPKIKVQDADRSSSPWAEEEETVARAKRRYSTPATPNDSVPNSPASSLAYFDDDREYKTWKKYVMLVYNRLTTHKYTSLFMKPITDEQAPGYHSIVYRPMDLQTIRKNIENGTIRNTLELQRDVLLMFTNAIMYNKTNDFVYNMTKQMQLESTQQLEVLLQAQQGGDMPQRRETRTSEPLKRKRPTEENIRVKKRKED